MSCPDLRTRSTHIVVSLRYKAPSCHPTLSVYHQVGHWDFCAVPVRPCVQGTCHRTMHRCSQHSCGAKVCHPECHPKYRLLLTSLAPNSRCVVPSLSCKLLCSSFVGHTQALTLSMNDVLCCLQLILFSLQAQEDSACHCNKQSRFSGIIG